MTSDHLILILIVVSSSFSFCWNEANDAIQETEATHPEMESLLLAYFWLDQRGKRDWELSPTPHPNSQWTIDILVFDNSSGELMKVNSSNLNGCCCAIFTNLMPWHSIWGILCVWCWSFQLTLVKDVCLSVSVTMMRKNWKTASCGDCVVRHALSLLFKW